MRILCVSDTTKSLAFSNSVKDIYKDIDVIMSCGDLRLSNHDYISTMLKADVFYVYGNHHLDDFQRNMRKHEALLEMETEDYESKFYGFLVDGKCKYDPRTGLIIAGLGGSMRYNNGDSQYTERQMRLRIAKMLPTLLWNKLRYGRYLDILITHAPPAGIGDGEDLCHKGFKCFLDFMDRFKPKYLLHGHIHLIDLNSNRVSQYKDTQVINIFGSYLLEDNTIGGSNG